MADVWGKLNDTRYRLELCWKTDLDWNLFPDSIKDIFFKAGYAIHSENAQKCTTVQKSDIFWIYPVQPQTHKYFL